MKRALLAVVLASSVTALGAAPAAANDPQSRADKLDKPTRTDRRAGTDQTPSVGRTPSSGREIQGTVVQSDAGTVYLEHMGAIVPLRIDASTRFSGGVRSSRDLVEGQQVRASFDVQQTTNLAREISRAGTPGREPAGPSGAASTDGVQGQEPVPPHAPRMPPATPRPPHDPGMPPVAPGVPPAPKY